MKIISANNSKKELNDFLNGIYERNKDVFEFYSGNVLKGYYHLDNNILKETIDFYINNNQINLHIIFNNIKYKIKFYKLSDNKIYTKFQKVENLNFPKFSY